ncbi:hypothetical protein ABTG57_18530, partial [Acinetobacter baumannii]
TSYPSCNLNFSNLGKLYLQRLYATKPTETHESLFEQIFDSLIKTFVLAKVNLSKLDVELFVEESKQGSVIFLPFTTKQLLRDCSKFCVST